MPLEDSPLVMRVDDVRELVLKPDDDTFKKGVHWRTNSLGMRDRAYAVAKPPRTFRIALVGDSIGAGWGVDVEQTVRVDSRANLGRSLAGRERTGRRDHQLRRPGPISGAAVVPFQPGRLADESGYGDL